MFNKEFYPTPTEVAERMIDGFSLRGKAVLEPSAGKGDLVKVLQREGANVIACEKNADLRVLTSQLCPVIAEDFFTLTSDRVSHIDFIVMNPPFSNADKHILHAWEIAPAGCTILALCNLETINKRHRYSYLEKFADIIEENGHFEDWSNCFEDAERKTQVEVGFISIQKPGVNNDTEFEGFFMTEDEEPQGSGIMKHNSIRELVNRYVAAVKIFDAQLDSAVKIWELTSVFSRTEYFKQDKPELGCLRLPESDKQAKRTRFKKAMQIEAWHHVIGLMNMQKYATRGLKEDINKFVEQQSTIPFTMRNIYRMLEIVIGTNEQRMDKALLEIFDTLTKHTHENRYHVPGWKTNSHYLVNKRFIFPYGAELNWTRGVRVKTWSGCGEVLQDFEKALCYISGDNFDTIKGIYHLPDSMEPGQWHDTHFFKVRAYKKGTVHCEFLNEDLWGRYNQRIAKLKGFPLYEHRTQTDYQKRQTGQPKEAKPDNRQQKATANVLFEFDLPN